jgi:hypothetical protein
MKPLAELLLVEKAQVLFQLFPESIPSFIDFLSGFIDSQKSYKPQVKENTSHTIPLKQLIQPPEGLEQLLQGEYNALSEHASYAAERLFSSVNAAYVLYCLEQFVTVRQAEEKFTLAVRLLFF